MWDVIFSWTLNPLSGAVSKICWLTAQHTEEMSTQKFLPFLLGLVLLPDYVSLSWGSHCWVLVLSAPTYLCQPQLCSLPTLLCVTWPVWSPAGSSYKHSQPACPSSILPSTATFAVSLGTKCFTQLSTSLRVASAANHLCAWALAQLNEGWRKALHPFCPAPTFHLCPTAVRKALHSFLLCTAFGCVPFTSTSPHLLGCECKGAGLILTQQFQLIQLLT